MSFLDTVETQSSPFDSLRVHMFWSRVIVGDGCWEWQGVRDRGGYGQTSYKCKTVTTHRFSYFLTHGEWPPVVMHICDNRICVRPSHLKSGSYLENNRDAFRKGRKVNKKKDFCKRGHPMVSENLWISNDFKSRPKRTCKLCKRQREKENTL